MVIFRSKVEEHGQRDRAQSAFKNASVFDYRELYLSYGEKQGESGTFQLEETCFKVKETCFQVMETCFQPKETSFKQKETSFQVKETSFQVNETCFQQMETFFKLNETCFQRKEICSNFDEKSSILACFWMQLPSACRFFRGWIPARISTKSHRFWCAFWCNYHRRVDCFSWLNFCSNFDEK